jgi:phosphoglycerate dehydrogenase-like enzyme
MDQNDIPESADVLVLSPNASDYRVFMEDLASAGSKVAFANTVGEAAAIGDTFPVILGQPDLAAGYLEERAGVRWVQSTWAGVTPLLASGRRDYLLTGIKGVFGPQISEYVLGYLLAHELKLLERLGRQARRNWWPEDCGTLSGKTMGIMGTGSIGACLAAMAAPFGLRVLGLNRTGTPVDGFQRVYPADQVAEFLPGLDYLVCTLPQTRQTDALLDADAFGAVTAGCYFVNVGRGSVVDEKALLDALSKGILAGAVLDVFRDEPLPPDNPLWHAPETLVTAHVAARSHPADIAKIFLDNHRRFRRGEALKHRVDFDRGY